MSGFYDDPKIYDILHAPGTAAEARGLMRIARRFAERPRGVWLEPACGTGRYLRCAANLGVRVMGFDRSEAMLAYAKSRIRSGARLYQADLGDFADAAPWRADFAFCLINTVRHVESDAMMARHLRDMCRVLRPGGVYAVGLSVTAYGLESPSEDVWQGRRGGCHVKQIIEFIPPESGRSRFERAINHLVITRGENEEHRDSTYRLRCFSRSQWSAAIRRGGMEIAGVVGPRGEDHDPGEMGYAIYVLRPITRG